MEAFAFCSLAVVCSSAWGQNDKIRWPPVNETLKAKANAGSIGRKQQVTSLNRKQKRPAPPTPAAPSVTAVGKKLAAAKRLRRAGRLREALAQGREILDVDPKQAETLHFLGSLSMEVNNFETAANLIGKAIAVDSGRAGYHRDLMAGRGFRITSLFASVGLP